MKSSGRAFAAMLVLAVASIGPAGAQGQAALASDRDKVSYMIGMDVAHSIQAAAPDVDVNAFERAVGNAFSGGKPLIAETRVKPLAQSLMQRIAMRNGKAPAGTVSPTVAKDQVGYLIGADIGRSLTPIKDEIDLAMFMRGLRTTLTGGKPLLAEAEASGLRSAFTQRMQARMQAQASVAGSKNDAEGIAFLARNKSIKGVYTTPSGLQYMVLRQGAGPRPKPGEHVRVNYRGTLLDGTVFDSSYDRGEPAEFGLDQVIQGWAEGVAMMPVGSKYRFWLPGSLAYGAKGTPGGPVGPNATLVFDVELMGIVQ